MVFSPAGSVFIPSSSREKKNRIFENSVDKGETAHNEPFYFSLHYSFCCDEDLYMLESSAIGVGRRSLQVLVHVSVMT